jgi:hypothetical protein
LGSQIHEFTFYRFQLRIWLMEQQAAVPRLMALFGYSWQQIVGDVDGVMKGNFTLPCSM